MSFVRFFFKPYYGRFEITVLIALAAHLRHVSFLAMAVILLATAIVSVIAREFLDREGEE